MPGPENLLTVSHVSQSYSTSRRPKPDEYAVVDVSLEIGEGEVLGIVGETGSGKSTLARTILYAPRPREGHVSYRGRNLSTLSRAEFRALRRQIGVVFQDPFASLDPRLPVSKLIREPLDIEGRLGRAERDERVVELMELVGLNPTRHLKARPRELSGGESQRVVIARALACDPKLLICDEPVSSLDVSIQAQIINLFHRLREEVGLAYLFISHDLGIVRHLSDRMGVMYQGRLCEVGPAEELYNNPRHPYTKHLLDVRPRLGARPAAPVAPEVPLVGDTSVGCRYVRRCAHRQDICQTVEPPPNVISNDVTAACHFPLSVKPVQASSRLDV